MFVFVFSYWTLVAFWKTHVKCNPSGCSNGQYKPSRQLIWASNPRAGFFQAAAGANFKEIGASNDAHLAQSQRFCITRVDFFPLIKTFISELQKLFFFSLCIWWEFSMAHSTQQCVFRYCFCHLLSINPQLAIYRRVEVQMQPVRSNSGMLYSE